MNIKKTAIIGAGINGLYLAWKLAQRNESVSVFEKKSEIGKLACSGLFSEEILKFIPESEKIIENRISSVFIHFPKKTLKVKFKNNFLMINHFKLDCLVADLAVKAGAEIYLSETIKENSEKLYSFDKIIGCDGADSIIKKQLKLPQSEFFLGIQGFIKEKNNLDFVEAWPTKNGFVWKIPRANETEWGIMEKPDKAKIVFNEFLNEKSINLINLKSALIPKKVFFPDSKNSKTTICGDAAGLVKPWSGGGVIWGLIAADLLLKNFPDFIKYNKELKKFFLFKIIFSRIAVKLVYFFGFNLYWLLPRKFKINNDFLI